MQRVTLADQREIPALGLGTWKAAPEDVVRGIRTAIDAGYRHIDCAHIYRNEAAIGQALDEAIRAGDVTRDELWITSKLWNDSHKRDQVEPALRETLKNLRLDYLDLYLIHWPVPQTADGGYYTLDEVPLEETWEGMCYALQDGLSRSIGVSNFSIAKIDRLFAATQVMPVMNQVECHPLLAQNELLNGCRERGVALTAYSPLGSRDRAAYMKRSDEPNLMAIPAVVAIAEKHGATPAQVLLAWHLHRGTLVIPKSGNPVRQKENLAAAELRLDTVDMDQLNALDRGFRFVDGTFWTGEGSPHTLESLWG